MRRFRTGGIVVAALLVTSCLDRSTSNPTEPAGHSSASISASTITRTAAAGPSLTESGPWVGTGGVVCPKNDPPASGWLEQPAACIEISGTTAVQPNESQTLTCDGWSDWVGQDGVHLHYPVADNTQRYWNISSTTVATITPSGSGRTAVLKGISVGNADVQCRIGNQNAVVYGSRSVSVATAQVITVNSIALTLLTYSIPAGETVPAGVAAYLSNGTTESPTPRPVVWSSSNPSVATVSGNGGSAVISTTNQGTAVITATLGSLTSSQTLTVTARAVASSFTISPSSVDINAGTTSPAVTFSNVMDQYNRPYNPPGGNSAVFSVANPALASVPSTASTSQAVTGKLAGSTTLVVLVDGTAQQSLPLVVRPSGTIGGISSGAVIGTSYTFTANTVGCNTTCTYKWTQSWIDTPTGAYRERVFGTAQTQSVPTPGDTYSYELYVELTSNGVGGGINKIVHVKQPTSCTSRTGC